MTQETVSPRGGSQAVRAARRDEAALLGAPRLKPRTPPAPRSSALYRFAAFASADDGRGYVVDGPLTTL